MIEIIVFIVVVITFIVAHLIGFKEYPHYDKMTINWRPSKMKRNDKIALELLAVALLMMVVLWFAK